jgi:hypothetical protein
VGTGRLGTARAALAADDTVRAHDAIAGADLRTVADGLLEHPGSRTSIQHHYMWCWIGCVGPGYRPFPRPQGPELCTILDLNFEEFPFHAIG